MSPDPEHMPFDLDESMGFLVYRAYQRFEYELSHRCRPYNITPAQWAVLNRLYQEEGLSQSELAARTAKDQPNTARIVRKLEQAGLVWRTTSPDDGRVSLVYLTPEARELVPILRPRAMGGVQKALTGLSPEDIETTRRVLRKVFENLT